MSGEELLEDFRSRGEVMNRYNKAIGELKAIGLEALARRIGEPRDLPFDNPLSQQILAMESAERRGWYSALAFIFDNDSYFKQSERSAEPPDFGAEETVKAILGK